MRDELFQLYSDEISLLAKEESEDYILLNLRKIQEYRKSFSIPFIGIAGADGKTTTKRMLASILSELGNTLETPLDCSTTTGVTSTLLKLHDKHKFAILELGIENPKQFEYAVKVSLPNIAAVTNIGEAHLAPLGDKYFIADAKVELIRRLPRDGFAVLNMDDDLVSRMEKISPTPRIIKFGFNSGAHFYASRVNYLGPDGLTFLVNDSYNFHMPIYGSANIYNALTAVSIARALGIDFEMIQKALETKFVMLKHRGNLIRSDDINILDHTYDATVNSVNKSCESLSQFKRFSKKLILVIGDVDYLGKKSETIHLNLGFYISALPIDTIITVGQKARLITDGIKKINHTKKVILSCRDTDNLSELVMNHLEPGTTILFIGSKKLKLGNVINSVTKDFTIEEQATFEIKQELEK
jgi:UDP-N-acetylmuramoyl-tripeptide--D-alanyl-D-alanine ligase